MIINKLPIDCAYYVLTFLPIKKQLLTTLILDSIDFIEYNNKKNMNEIFKRACERGHYMVIKKLLKNDKIDPSSNTDYAIKWASENGHFEVVKLLENHISKK